LPEELGKLLSSIRRFLGEGGGTQHVAGWVRSRRIIGPSSLRPRSLASTGRQYVPSRGSPARLVRQECKFRRLVRMNHESSLDPRWLVQRVKEFRRLPRRRIETHSPAARGGRGLRKGGRCRDC
jgi:hypothetical protein